MKKFLILSVIALFGFNYNASAQSCDTLRNWTPGNPLSIITGETGYVPGHEILGGDNILRWAEPLTATASTEVRAFRFAPTDISDAGGSITLTVRQDNAGVPGVVIASEVVLLADLTDGSFNTIEFTTPATVNGNFFACVEVEYSNYPANELGFISQEVTTGTLMMYDNTFGWDDVSNVYTLNNNPAQLSMVLDVLTSNAPDPIADFTINEAAVCLGSDFIVDGTPSQNTDEYSWFLTGPSITPIHDTDDGINGTLTPPVSGNSQEIYLLADGGCRTDAVFTTVDVYEAVTSTVSTEDPTCGLDNGEINISGSAGGDGTYSYSIDGGTSFQAQTSYTGLAAGSYDVIVSTSGGGCEYTETVTLTAITPETITAGGDETICEGDAVTITASGTGNIEWFDGGGNSVGTGTSVSVSPTTTTTYDAVLTDANGCTDTDQVQVTVNPVNDATFSYSSSTLCLGGANETPTINGTGTFTATPAGLVFADASTGEIDMTSSTANTYNVTFTTTGTCGETFMETITLTSSPDATFSYSAAEFCAEVGTEAPSFPTGASAGTFSATPAGLSINASNGTITLDASTANTYTVTNTIAASGSCPQVVATEDITINALPTVDAGADQEVCDGDQVTLTATGADTYTWDNGASQGVAFTPSVGVTTFTVTGEITATGCQNTDEVDVTVNENPTVDAGVDQEVCDGEEVTLTATTSVGTVSWDSGVTDGTPFTPTATATYTVTADNNGCTSTDQVTVTVNDLPLVDAGADQTACANHDPITLSGTPAGGTYSGTSVSGNEFDPSVGAGTYTITYTYTDGNGCEASNDLTVTVDGCASIDENNINESITIMPNPATDYIDVVMEGTNTINSIQLLSAEGRIVEFSTSTLNANTTRIDVSAAAKGTYFIQLNTLNGQITKKVILQ